MASSESRHSHSVSQERQLHDSLSAYLGNIQAQLVSEFRELLSKQLGELATRDLACLHAVAQQTLDGAGPQKAAGLQNGVGPQKSQNSQNSQADFSLWYPEHDRSPDHIPVSKLPHRVSFGSCPVVNGVDCPGVPRRRKSFRSVVKAVMFSNRLVVVTQEAHKKFADLTLQEPGTDRQFADLTEVYVTQHSVRSSNGRGSGGIHATFSNESKMSKVSLADVWTESHKPAERRMSFLEMRKSPSKLSLTLSQRAVRSGDEIMDGSSTLQKCVMKPSSWRCICWDLWTVVMIVHDLIMIPMAAFDLPRAAVMLDLELMSTCTWCIDMPLSFMRGFIDNAKGIVEMRLKPIALNYIKTWFFLDLGIIGIDIFFIWLDGSDWLQFITFLRFFRMLRLLRVLRILKINARMGTVKELILRMEWSSVYSDVLLNVLKQLLMIVVICHFTACGWYAIGTLAPTDSWALRHFEKREEMHMSSTWTYFYATSFHWAITQFTPASMEINPMNSIERIYASLVILGGLLVFSSFVGGITQSLTNLRQLTQADRLQNQCVRRYVSDHRISVELTGKILGFIKRHRMGHASRRLTRQDIKVLDSLPNSLQRQLHEEVFVPSLAAHPFLNILLTTDYPSCARLCNKGMSERIVMQAEEIFHAGMIAKKMYIIGEGKLSYTLHNPDWAGPPTIVTEGQRVSEAALWANWDHRGRLAGESLSTYMLEVNAAEFQAIMVASKDMLQLLRMYASLFVSRSSQEYGDGLLASDLWGNWQQVNAIAKHVNKFRGSELQSFMLQHQNLSDTLRQTVFDAWLLSTQQSKRKKTGQCLHWPFSKSKR
ncbi:unnamed protein product [Polarella glacialis]|uniref:Ion transport domain-containing protein n=1 Tax=Polarella glacialis TaxID=89957 RepID=A0A813DUY2_POLGL|nr:unnamed protein product [Polarella glacialis]